MTRTALMLQVGSEWIVFAFGAALGAWAVGSVADSSSVSAEVGIRVASIHVTDARRVAPQQRKIPISRGLLSRQGGRHETEKH